MRENPSWASALDPAGGAYSAPQIPYLMRKVERGLAAPYPRTPPLLSALQASNLGLRASLPPQIYLPKSVYVVN